MGFEKQFTHKIKINRLQFKPIAQKVELEF
jgi:hypothetical protein